MKWTPISKAKVKFGIDYLVATGRDYKVAKLIETRQTEAGLLHQFHDDSDTLVLSVTHVAIITDPTKG